MNRQHVGGFTLLEVLIALAILAMSLTVLSQSQTNAVTAVGRSRAMTIATQLARYKMVEIEEELFEEGFSEFEEEDKGDFDDEGHKAFGWVVKIDKVELPSSINPDSLTSALTGGGDDDSAGGGESKSPASGMFAVGAKMMSAQFEIFRNMLEQSIRRVSIRVTWQEGSRERYVSVVGYFTDPRKIENLGGGGLPSLPGTGGATGSTGATGGGTSGGTSTTPGRTGSSTPSSPVAPRGTSGGGR